MVRRRDQILVDVRALIAMHRAGQLGGGAMPEEVHPKLDPGGAWLAHYFTLPMALNYQRDSYALWRAATATYHDDTTRAVFDPLSVIDMDDAALWAMLHKYKVGLQQTRHPKIWRTISGTLAAHYDGDVRRLFAVENGDIAGILRAVCVDHKAGFPYLSGPKISNYWLYVMSCYTHLALHNRAALSIAPDTHVIQASINLGMIDKDKAQPTRVAELWADLLADTELTPIDIHTPLWLWSRSGFIAIGREAA
jgi:hypothetical protein